MGPNLFPTILFCKRFAHPFPSDTVCFQPHTQEFEFEAYPCAFDFSHLANTCRSFNSILLSSFQSSLILFLSELLFSHTDNNTYLFHSFRCPLCLGMRRRAQHKSIPKNMITKCGAEPTSWSFCTEANPVFSDYEVIGNGSVLKNFQTETGPSVTVK